MAFEFILWLERRLKQSPYSNQPTDQPTIHFAIYLRKILMRKIIVNDMRNWFDLILVFSNGRLWTGVFYSLSSEFFSHHIEIFDCWIAFRYQNIHEWPFLDFLSGHVFRFILWKYRWTNRHTDCCEKSLDESKIRAKRRKNRQKDWNMSQMEQTYVIWIWMKWYKYENYSKSSRFVCFIHLFEIKWTIKSGWM